MEVTRFIGRREYFGSLFYDFERGDYIPFDWDATYIFDLRAQGFSIDEIADRIKERVSKQSFLTFVQLCQSIELFNKEQEMVGHLLPGKIQKGKLSAPLRVHLQLTNECSFNCRHCSQDSREALEDELSLEEIFKLIDEMASIGVFELSIGGGDPFLREKDLLEIVKYASLKRVGVFISTTALSAGRITLRKLSQYPIRGIRISFDGSMEKSYDYHRGKGSYRRVMRSIKTFREIFHCPITIHTVLMKSNYTEILLFIRAVQKMKCDSWSIDFARPIGSAKQHEKIFLSPMEMRDTLRTIQKLQKSSSTPILLRHFPVQDRGKKLYRGFGCVGGNINCFIDASGNVFPCSFTRERYKGGNIREHSLRDIWLFSANLELFRAISGNEQCKACNYYETCRGGCRARGMDSGGSDFIDPACFLKIEDQVEV